MAAGAAAVQVIEEGQDPLRPDMLEEDLDREALLLELSALRSRLAALEQASQRHQTDLANHQQIVLDLRESEERFRQLAANLPIGMAVHTGGVVVWVNAEAVRLVGAASADSQVGRNVMHFVAPDFVEQTQQRIAMVYGKERTAEWMESRFVRADGRPFDVEVASTIIDWRGEPAGLVLFSDIDSRKQVEQERQKLVARVQETQRMESLAVLAGGVAHDFNNLLVGILGNADLALLQLPTDSPARPRIAGIELAARRAAELARQMLAYAGRGRLVIEEMDLDTLIGRAVRLAESATVHQAQIELNLATDLPAIRADGTQLGQVLMNLVTNAVEAMGERDGRIQISTGQAHVQGHELVDAWHDEAEVPGDYVWLEVQDDGAGMDEATRRRIFDPFFSTKFTGRGLGLAAVLGIIKGHRGAIVVSSELGVGTRFRVLLPVGEPAGERPPAAPPPAAGVKPLGSGHILVVDDEATVREVAQECLEDGGFRVTQAAGGREAVALLSADDAAFDGVLLDLSMPHMNGSETMEALRAAGIDVPVVLTSGHNEAEALFHFDGAHPAAFLQKPYRVTDLLTVVGRALAGADAELAED